MRARVGDSEEITSEESSDHLEHGIWNMARSEMGKKKESQLFVGREQNMKASLADCQITFKKKEKVDVEGFEPSTSRMQSVRATTVPNAP